MKKKTNKTLIWVIVALAVIGLGVGAYFIFRKKDDPQIGFNGFVQLGSYTVGSDTRGGSADSGGFYRTANVCTGLGISLEELYLHNPALKGLDQLLSGIKIKYPTKQIA